MEEIYDAYYIYILTNKHHTVLYTGVTSDLYNRLNEHRQKAYPGFTAKYNVDKLVYFEQFGNVYDAIDREKQIKGGSRQKKIDLINSKNPDWEDLWEKELRPIFEEETTVSEIASPRKEWGSQ